jgi:hypothetical protein
LLTLLPQESAEGREGPSAAVDTARMDRAGELTRLSNPFDVMVAANMRGWESAIARSLALDPAAAKLEARYPGIGKTGIEAARPLARRYFEAFVTQANRRTTQTLAERLSDDEIDELLRFYRSPLGRRAVKQAFANFDYAGVGREVADGRARTGKAEITMDQVKRQGDLAHLRAAPEFSAADHLAMMRFAQTPAARKFAAAREASEREILQMVNSPDPDFIAAQTQALRAAMIAFADSAKRP